MVLWLGGLPIQSGRFDKETTQARNVCNEQHEDEENGRGRESWCEEGRDEDAADRSAEQRDVLGEKERRRRERVEWAVYQAINQKEGDHELQERLSPPQYGCAAQRRGVV